MKAAKENIEIFREDSGTIILKPVKGNYSNRLNYITFKRDKNITSDRLIEKSSSASQVRCTYNSAKDESTFEFDYLPGDTSELSAGILFYDIESQNPLDANDRTTPKWGYCKLIGDVKNDFDGFILPQTAVRFQYVDAANGGVGDIVQINSAKQFEFISLISLKAQLAALP